MTALLEVDRISKSFSGLKAMQDVSFAVPEGAIVGLIGPNGAGKTTCFNVIAGVYRADAGEVRFAGKRIDGWRSDQICRAGVGRTFQLVKPFAGLTVMENVVVGALNASASVREAKERAAEVIEQLGLGSKREQMACLAHAPRAQAAGGGARARHRPAPAPARRGDGRPAPDRDRPHGGAVPRAERQARAHDPAHRARHARGDGAVEPLIVLHHGQVIASGSPAEVTRDPAVLECYLGEEAV